MSFGPGHDFVQGNPDLFTGCSCSRGVAVVMNRWKPDMITDRHIANVVRTIRSKKPQFTEAEVTNRIRQHFGI